jgi:flagellar biogenesis protein FliO
MSSSRSTYDFSKSDLLMMVGGQIAILLIVIMVVWFGVRPIQFEYADQIRNMVRSTEAVSAAAATVVKNAKK